MTWDFDGDGIFDDDQDGYDTNLSGTGTFIGNQIQHVQCRVTDTGGAYTDSNILAVQPIVLPYIDPMDASSESR